MKKSVPVRLLLIALVMACSLHAEEKKISAAAVNDSLIVAGGDLALKNYDKAMEKYKAILALDPANEWAKIYMANINLHRGNFAEAYQMMKPVADKYPDWAPGNIDAGWYAFLVKNFKECKDYYDKAWKEDSTNLALRINLGHLALAQGRVKEAEGLYLPAIHEIISRKAYERRIGEDFEEYLPKIIKPDVLKKEKKLIEAEFAKMEKAWRKNDAAAKPLSEKAEAAYNANNDKEAIALIEKLLALTPDNASAYVMLAECWKQQGDTNKFLQYQGKALEVDDECATAYLNYGIMQYNSKHYLLAVNNFRAFLKYDTHNDDDQSLKAEELIAKSHFYLANRLLTEEEDRPGARAIFLQMLADKEHLYPKQTRMGALVIVHDDPKGDAIIKTAIARTYVLENQGAEATPYLQEAMELDASYEDIYFLQGMVAFLDGNQNLCIEKFKKAARLGSQEAKEGLQKFGVEN